MVLTQRSLEVSAKVLLIVVALGALSYYVAVARTTDISFDGAIFLQHGHLMTAIVPSDFFKVPGLYPIWIYDKATKARSGSITMTIEAP